MILLAVSDVVWQAIIAAVVTIILAWMNQRTKDAVETTGEKASGKAEEVKAALEQSTTATAAALEGLAETGNKTHTLVNSAMGAQLRLHAETARAKADITRDAADVAVADLAERMHREHAQKQAAADRQG